MKKFPVFQCDNLMLWTYIEPYVNMGSRNLHVSMRSTKEG